MKKTLFLTLILIFAFNTCKIFAQSEIWLMEGKKISTDTLVVDTSGFIKYKNKRGKTKYLYTEEVFSVKQDDEIQYFYEYNAEDSTFTIQQMTDYLQGVHDGYEYKSQGAFSGGVAIGILTPIVSQLIGIPAFIYPIIPAAYIIGVGIPKIKDKNIDVPTQYQDNEYYIFGYKQTAKRKRISNTILGSGIGIVIGVSSALIIYGIE